MSSPAEMNSPAERELVERLDADPYYHDRFRVVFREGPTLKDVAKALAAFERTLIARNSRFDRYARGDKRALTMHEKKWLGGLYRQRALRALPQWPKFHR